VKRCKVCGEIKPLGEFYRAAGMADGHRSDCKACNLAAKAARYRLNPEPDKERVRRWRREHPEEYAALLRRWRESGSKKAADRRYHLKRKFGLTPEDYERMLRNQSGGCAICGAPPPPGKSLHIDHDHVTGEVRGLLCFKHNNALGDFDDDPELLHRALRYLRRPDELDEIIRSRALALVSSRPN
jgi:hypothetical protein